MSELLRKFGNVALASCTTVEAPAWSAEGREGGGGDFVNFTSF